MSVSMAIIKMSQFSNGIYHWRFSLVLGLHKLLSIQDFYKKNYVVFSVFVFHAIYVELLGKSNSHID